jgi:thiamine biosynthesis protein ThiS
MITGSDSTNVTICVNGKHEAITSPATVAKLVEMPGPRPPFAVEVNKRLVRRADYAVTELHDGDIVEIVTLVGGG